MMRFVLSSPLGIVIGLAIVSGVLSFAESLRVESMPDRRGERLIPVLAFACSAVFLCAAVVILLR